MFKFKFKTFIVSAGLMSLGSLSFYTTSLRAQPQPYPYNVPLVRDNIPSENNPVQGGFRVQVASDNGIVLRNSTTQLGDRSNISVAKGQSLDCNAWAFGIPVQALGLNRPDYRWYRVSVNGRNYWVPAAWVFGDAPGSVANPLNPDN